MIRKSLYLLALLLLLFSCKSEPSLKSSDEAQNLPVTKDGWKIYFDKKGDTIRKEQIINIKGQKYLNQLIIYSNGKIDKDESYYIDVNIPDTLIVGRSIVQVEYEPHFSNGYITTCIGKDLFPDFSNITEVKVDSFSMSDRSNIWFGIENIKPGKRVIRGFVNEEFYEVSKDTTDLRIISSNMYFEKEVFVK